MNLRILLACLAGLALVGPARAQFHPDARRAYLDHWHTHPEHPESLVRLWHQRLFHAEIPAPLLNRWTLELRNGIAPIVALGHVLASPEFYVRVGSTPAGFVQTTFTEVVGRPPTPAEYQFWLQRLYVVDRAQVANEMLARYPPGWAVGGAAAPAVITPAVAAPPPMLVAPPVEVFEYRRPIVRYR